jgi:hypothetical protein
MKIDTVRAAGRAFAAPIPKLRRIGVEIALFARTML